MHLENMMKVPTAMGEDIRHYLEEGLLNIVGGCCGTTLITSGR